MLAEPPRRPGTPEQAGRSSFSSIRENDSRLAQTFTSSKTSAYANYEEAVDDSLPPRDMGEVQFVPPITHPHSKLHGYWSPADSFRGWKQINVKGKLASKSFGDLQVLNLAWNHAQSTRRSPGSYAPGHAPMERLPVEILTFIINMLVLDIPPNGISRRNVDLMSLLLASKTLHTATLSTLYSKITIPHSRIFQKFLAHISTHQALGTIVRRLDFCHFNPSQLFSTASERSQARNLTSETLMQCLELSPYLQEFLAQEYIDDDLTVAVLQKLFFGLPRMQALDFCGCSSTPFKNAFTSLVQTDWPPELGIRRLSLHKCLTLPSSVFETLLPRLIHLTHLDVAGTRITDSALASIPHTARITHLNLAKCTLLSPESVTQFLAAHPAVTQTLQFLSLATDARSHQLLDVEDVTKLIPVLPKTLKSLSLRGSKMDKAHISMLIPLTKHLEELALGRCIKLEDLNELFLPDEENIDEALEWVPHTLRFLDLSDMWGGEMNLAYLFSRECVTLKPFAKPLEVIEIPEDTVRRFSKSPSMLNNAGWRTSECGSRTWLVRNHSGSEKADNGRRAWKMGAENWGMRKIPMAPAEVGGMYGNFMFSRKL